MRGRVYRIGKDHLVTAITIKYESTLRPATDEVMEYVCQENNQYGVAGGAR